MRIGQGFDVHALVPGRKLVIGGVEIPHDRGLAGHSDADVLLHAICDALIGAAGLGDIGRHFPDTDPRYKGIDSRHLLREVARLLDEARLRVMNVDSTIIAETPKMAPYLEAMRANIAADLAIAIADVNVKAKTSERLGALGRQEGIAAEAVALVERPRRERNGKIESGGEKGSRTPFLRPLAESRGPRRACRARPRREDGMRRPRDEARQDPSDAFLRRRHRVRSTARLASGGGRGAKLSLSSLSSIAWAISAARGLPGPARRAHRRSRLWSRNSPKSLPHTASKARTGRTSRISRSSGRRRANPPARPSIR